MSRKIKFRVWRAEDKIYVKIGSLLILEGIDSEFSDKSGKYVVEQYTGLKDKNGKEIYEGDIVYDIYTGDEVFIVGWDKDKASFMLADTANYPMAYFDEYKLDKDLEVIGNIHENPELLGDGE